jgi:GntR family transcriptional regulator/MocR family aminotransferase
LLDKPNSNSHFEGSVRPFLNSLLIRIDPRAPEGLQKQIYSGIRQAILEGVLPPGARLPSSRALAIDLNVSRTTTLLAFDQLFAEGYLATKRGSGTFVAHELPDDLPRSVVHRSPGGTKHPPLSDRGQALASTPTAASRILGPPRPFRMGVPALDLFPIRLWSQLVNRRLRSLTVPQLDYSSAAGLCELRQAIADHVQAVRGTRCGPEDIFITAGSQRALSLICDVLLDPGDQAWLEEPGFAGARSALVGAGARIVPVPVGPDGLDVEAGASLAPRARLAYVTPSHQYPLGVPMSLPRRLALLKWASHARAWIVEDDYDSEFRYGSRPIPCLHGLDVDGRVIYVGSFSKTLFPALRLGFLILPPDLGDRLVAARRAADIHPPFLEQAVLADLMAGGHYERHLRRMRAAYRERLEMLVDSAKRHCKGVLQIRPVRTGLHAVADLIDADPEDVWQEARDRGVEVMPLARCFLGRPREPRALLLGFASMPPAALDAGMAQLGAAIEAAGRPARRRAGDRGQG